MLPVLHFWSHLARFMCLASLYYDIKQSCFIHEISKTKIRNPKNLICSAWKILSSSDFIKELKLTLKNCFWSHCSNHMCCGYLLDPNTNHLLSSQNLKHFLFGPKLKYFFFLSCVHLWAKGLCFISGFLIKVPINWNPKF